VSKKRSDGYFHARISIALSIPAAVITAVAFFIPLEWGYRAILGLLGCLLGILISPDADIDGISHMESIWFKIPLIGWILGIGYYFYWYPYAYFFKHRGISHSILGTFTRILYLLLWTPVVLIALTLASFVLLSIQDAFVSYPRLDLILYNWIQLVISSFWITFCLSIGLFFSDVGHILRDKFGLEV
jgi:uncharacterized metal-binding protein